MKGRVICKLEPIWTTLAPTWEDGEDTSGLCLGGLKKIQSPSHSRCNSVAITPRYHTAPPSCKNGPAFGESPFSLQRAMLKELDSIYHMLPLFFPFPEKWLPNGTHSFFPATLRAQPEPQNRSPGITSCASRWRSLHLSQHPSDQDGVGGYSPLTLWPVSSPFGVWRLWPLAGFPGLVVLPRGWTIILASICNASDIKCVCCYFLRGHGQLPTNALGSWENLENSLFLPTQPVSPKGQEYIGSAAGSRMKNN